MKINGLGRIAVGLLAIVFVGNVFSMVMTPKEREKAKVAAQKMMKEIQQQQQTKLEEERKKQFQPGKYFVYEKDTSKGVLIGQDLLEKNSEMVKGLVESFGSRPQEISLPFPVEAIKFLSNVLDNKIFLANRSLAELIILMHIGKYLLLSNDVMNNIKVAYDEALKTCPLEQLVDAFNKTSNSSEKIFENIMEIVREIILSLLAQYIGDKDTEFFKRYKGKMISIPNLRSIPDYKVLNDMNREYEQRYLHISGNKKTLSMLIFFINRTTGGSMQESILNNKEYRLVDFVELMIQQIRYAYESSYWRIIGL